MTGAGECARIRYALGVYVLGALEPAGRHEVDEHLAECHSCREDLAVIAGLPGLLGRVTPDEAGRLAHGEAGWPDSDSRPAAVLPSLLTQTARIRQTRRRSVTVAAVVAVAVALAAGAGTGVAMGRVLHSAPPPQSSRTAWTTVSASSRVTNASATVRYARAAWGTQLNVQVSGIPAGTTCQLWVINPAGQSVAAGGWTIARGQVGAWYPASASVPASHLRDFDITADGKILVIIPVR